MRLPVSIPLVILFVICMLMPEQPASSEPGAPAKGDPHDFFLRYNMGCKECHVSVGIKSRGVMRKSVSEICAGCHTLPVHSHVVDIEPAFEVPRDLPLDVHGLLTCATCHDPHRPYLNPASGERTRYLRRDGTRRQLCESCHLHNT